MVNLLQLARGAKVVAHSGISATATSAEQNSRGHNAMILYFDLTAATGTWTIKIQGKCPITNAFIDMYDNTGTLMSMASVTADKAQLFVGIPDNFKIVATEDVNGATITVAYELLTV